MLNNKGFAVSTVLYTLLIAFLMFLGAALAMFSSSSSIIGKANNDLINGNDFSAEQYQPAGSDQFKDNGNRIFTYPIKCKSFGSKEAANEVTDANGIKHYIFTEQDDEYSMMYWNDTSTIIKIKTRTGNYKYWPRDFDGASVSCTSSESCIINEGITTDTINVSYIANPDDIDYLNYGKLIFTDDIGNSDDVILKDICY